MSDLVKKVVRAIEEANLVGAKDHDEWVAREARAGIAVVAHDIYQEAKRENKPILDRFVYQWMVENGIEL